jgi:prevent-host-death family protein
MKMAEVGSYEAKTHLPRLLERVARGERITITRRGVPVAMLVPPDTGEKTDVAAVVEEMLAARAGRTLGDDLTIRQLIEEGRRF